MEFISNMDGIANVKRKLYMSSVMRKEQASEIEISDSLNDTAHMDNLANLDSIEGRLRNKTLMQRQFALPAGILCTTAVMSLLIALVYFMNIPNPNMILIAGLVLCSALFGFSGGLVAAVIMGVYTIYFFSFNHSFIHFNSEGMMKVVVSYIGIIIDMVLVCSLKSAEIQAFSDIDELVKRLHKENEMLHSISMFDALTGIRNRMALRHDCDLFRNCEVTVMMLDLDDFKAINDTKGHEEGDRVLIDIGKLLASTFGRNQCYRYGGDEFVVVSTKLTSEEFEKKLDFMKKRRPVVEMNGVMSEISYSVGYIHRFVTGASELNDLFAEADVRMYRTKRAKKEAGTSRGDAE